MRFSFFAMGATCAAVGSLGAARPLAHDPQIRASEVTSSLHAIKKADADPDHSTHAANETSNADEHPILGTLFQTHTGELVVLDKTTPTAERLSKLLADRVTGSETTFDPRLIELIRKLAAQYPLSRIELVSGFRSPKLNEMLRKKGHAVASHSQHSLGHAIDFRIVPVDAERGIDPNDLEKAIRALGWEGGVGVYTKKTDWFVHADVGRNRRW